MRVRWDAAENSDESKFVIFRVQNTEPQPMYFTKWQGGFLIELQNYPDSISPSSNGRALLSNTGNSPGTTHYLLQAIIVWHFSSKSTFDSTTPSSLTSLVFHVYGMLVAQQIDMPRLKFLDLS